MLYLSKCAAKFWKEDFLFFSFFFLKGETREKGFPHLLHHWKQDGIITSLKNLSCKGI